MSGFEAACVNGSLAQSTPQELCMLLQGVAALRLQPGSSWVAALQAAVLQQLGSLSPRDISQVCLVMYVGCRGVQCSRAGMWQG